MTRDGGFWLVLSQERRLDVVAKKRFLPRPDGTSTGYVAAKDTT